MKELKNIFIIFVLVLVGWIAGAIVQYNLDLKDHEEGTFPPKTEYECNDPNHSK
jgi:hypothetical protein